MDNFQSIIIHWKFAVVACLLVLGGEVVAKNADLTLAKKRKKDELYTQLVDIENELKHYLDHFKDKIVLCNCDDPRESNFFKYFADNFEKLRLKRLIATCYKSQDVDLFSQGDCERAICQIYEAVLLSFFPFSDSEDTEYFCKGFWERPENIPQEKTYSNVQKTVALSIALALQEMENTGLIAK